MNGEQEFDYLNVIPLVDVMLVLLTIVLTTSTFIATGGIAVNLPKAEGGEAATAVESRSIVVEGAHIGAEAVLGANTVITGSTHIIDVSNSEPVYYSGYVPPRSVVIPGSYLKHFPAGDYSVSCALIIGQRKESTDKKTSLNSALREFGIS